MTTSGVSLRILSVFALTILAIGCGDGSTDGQGKPIVVAPGSTLTTSKGSSDLAAPDHPDWNNVPEHHIDLEMAPAVHPSVALRQTGDEKPLPTFVRVARSDQSLYVRLRWEDATANTVVAREMFADGAAVQFALNAEADTAHMMGDPDAPVNIWYWNAGSDEAQNLAAGGFGSTTRFDTKSLKASAQHNADQGGQWTVVFSRPLASEGDHEADLTALDGVQLAFAVWQGANGERDGLKRTSTDWMTLSTGASN